MPPIFLDIYDMASRVLSRDYRLKANSPSGTIADQDTFTYDSSSRMLTGVSGRYVSVHQRGD